MTTEKRVSTNISVKQDKDKTSYCFKRRKDAARKNLINLLYTKHRDGKYSFSCCDECINSDVRFPRVNSFERSVRRETLGNSDSSKTYSANRCTSLELLDGTGQSDQYSREEYAVYGKSKSQHISLPEIIMEFNIEANISRSNAPFVETNEEERFSGATYEDYLKRMKYTRFNPCRSKHRPVTPGLLDSLNKLKLPSKVKTEQWVRSSQSMQKSLHIHVYKTNQNWIYSD